MRSGPRERGSITADLRGGDLTIDVTDECSVQAAAAAAGPVDVLVNSAGILTESPLVDDEPAQWQQTIDVDLTGIFLACRHVVPGMVERGWGRVINVASQLGHQGRRRADPLQRGEGRRDRPDQGAGAGGRAAPGCLSTRSRLARSRPLWSTGSARSGRRPNGASFRWVGSGCRREVAPDRDPAGQRPGRQPLRRPDARPQQRRRDALVCGACGTNGAGHWSAPFLASQAARSAAAKAVTAMTGRGVTVVGTPAGYVVGTPTGNRRAVADLGQVWNIVAPPGSPCRIGTAPVGLLGPATVPPLRAALTRVVLVVTRTGAFRGNATARMAQPEGDGEIDARQIGSAELPVRLRECADTQRSRVLRVLVDMADVDRLLAELPADPTRPFAVTDVLDRDDPKPTIPLYTDGSFQQLPGMLAWLAAHDGSTPHHNLRVQLPMPNRHILAIDLIRGLVTRCELQSNPVQLGSAQNRRRF